MVELAGRNRGECGKLRRCLEIFTSALLVLFAWRHPVIRGVRTLPKPAPALNVAQEGA